MFPGIFGALAGIVLAGAASAAEYKPLQPIDLTAPDDALHGDIYGPWDVHDRTGTKRCRVVLKREATIGGSAIEVSAACAKLFPVMGEVTAWRLLENWTIDFTDALRKTRVRFSTPDARYVAIPEIDGIGGMEKPRAKR